MAEQRHWAAWISAFVALAIAAVGLWYGGMWYAHRQMKMPGMGESESGMKGMPGMEMPGMKMDGEKTDTSAVEGYVEVKISPDLQQRLGVTIGEVEKAPLEISVRTVGIVQPDETKVAHINLKTEGWVEELFVNYTGQDVQKGDPLLAIYSPDFFTTQAEYLVARQAAKSTLGLMQKRDNDTPRYSRASYLPGSGFGSKYNGTLDVTKSRGPCNTDHAARKNTRGVHQLPPLSRCRPFPSPPWHWGWSGASRARERLVVEPERLGQPADAGPRNCPVHRFG